MNILLVEDPNVTQHSLQPVLNATPKVSKLTRLTQCDEALAQLSLTNVTDNPIDLALFDISANQGDPLAILSHLAASDAKAKVGFAAKILPRAVMRQAMQRGAVLFLSKPTDRSTVQQALTIIARGGQYMPSDTRPSDVQQRATQSPARLSPTQLTILELMRDGLSNPQIAKQLELAESTVNGYTRTIYNVIQASNALECTASARQLDLTA